MEDKAADVWATAGRSHLNLDFTFGSQALAVAFTDAESIGGRVWPNVIFSDKQYDYAFSVWGNSTLGLLSYWWHSNRQQSSKAGMTIRSAGSLQVLDLRALTDEQLRAAEAIFNEFLDKELKPAYLVTPTPTAPSWTSAWSVTFWASTRTYTWLFATSRPSGARSLPCMAERRAQRLLSL